MSRGMSDKQANEYVVIYNASSKSFDKEQKAELKKKAPATVKVVVHI